MGTTTFWTGRSGTSYEFYVHPIGTEFLPISGVYIFCRQVTATLLGGTYEALYVGEAQSLFDRLNSGVGNHDGFKRASREGMTHIAAMRCSSAERLWVETDLRHGLDPICNRQSVPTLLGDLLTKA